MDQQQNVKKRRFVEQLNRFFPPMMIEQSTMTECQKPMNLNVWTQTELEDARPSIFAGEIELRNRILKLEEKLKTHALLLNELASRDDNKNNSNPSTSFKYKIVSEGHDIQLEPIVVECTGDEEVIYYEALTDTNINAETNHDDDHEKYQTSPVSTSSQQNQNHHTSNDSKQEMYSTYNTRSRASSPKEKYVALTEGTSNAIPCSAADNHNRFISSTTAPSTSFPNMQFNNSNSAPMSQPSPHDNHETTSIIQQQPNHNHTFNGAINTPSSHHSHHNEARESPETMNSSNVQTQNNVNSHIKFKSAHNATMNIYTPPADSEISVVKSNEHVKVSSSSSHNQDHIVIGPNNTRIPLHIYENIDWSSTATATRKLLTTVFDRITLATHSLTGKPSPAFHDRNKPSKKQLNPKIISDIIYAVSRKCNVAEREVRSAITTKCADENKMLRLRERKQKNEFNKENIVNNDMM